MAFNDTSGAAKAIALSGTEFGGRQVYIDSARERGQGGGGAGGAGGTPGTGGPSGHVAAFRGGCAGPCIGAGCNCIRAGHMAARFGHPLVATML